MIVMPLVRTIAIVAVSLALLSGAPASRAADEMQVLKTASCGCCIGWIRHLQAHGFAVQARDVPQATLTLEKLKAGIRPELASCHTGRVGPYVIEGHVPAPDVKRLLRERPDAIGLTVPEMPIGSPGMEAPDGARDPYDVLLVRRDGSTEVYARYR